MSEILNGYEKEKKYKNYDSRRTVRLKTRFNSIYFYGCSLCYPDDLFNQVSEFSNFVSRPNWSLQRNKTFHVTLARYCSTLL